MTESRQFGVTANDENFLLITDNGRELSQLQVCALLNDFNDENNELREYNREMVKDIKDLEKENEQLKQQLRIIIDTAEQNDVITKSELKRIKKEL